MKALLQTHGSELFEPPANRPFSIHRPDSAWIVQSGNLDLFLVDVADGQPVGARHPVLRVEQGSAVFGIRATSFSSIVMAVGTPGTKLMVLPLEVLRTSANDSAHGAEVLALLEEWVSKLAGSVAVNSSPRQYAEVRPGEAYECANDAQAVLPEKGVVWVEHVVGASRLLNTSETAEISSPGYFPVSRKGWIQAARGTKLLPLRSSDWQKSDPEWRGLQAFHAAILQSLMLNRRKSEESNRERRQSQAVSDKKVVGAALQSLASSLQAQGTVVLPAALGSSHPTFLACAAIGKSLGVKMVAPVELRSRGMLLDIVGRIAAASGLRYRRVVLKGKWWTNSTDPLLVFRESDHGPMAIIPTHGTRSSYRLYDPADGRNVPLTSELAMSLHAFAYTFYPPLPTGKLSLWDLMKFALQHTFSEVWTVVSMGAWGGLLALVIPVATGVIFDSIIPNAQRTQLLQITGILAALTVATAAFTLSRNLAMLRLEGKMGAALQAAVWDRLLRLPVPFFRRFTSGDLADRSLGINQILRTLAGSVISSILSGVFSIFSFLLLFYYSWKLALVASVVVLVSFVVSAIGLYLQVKYQREMFHMRGRISGMVLGFVDNIGRLRVSGAEPRAFAAWAQEFARQKRRAVRGRTISNALAVFNSAFPVIGMAVIFGFSVPLISQPLLRGLTTGTFLAFLAAFIQFQGSSLQLINAAQSALGIIPMYERAVPILETLPEVSEGNRHPGELQGNIEISHVHFRYHPDTPLVLRDVSLSVKPGEFVAIVGPSGSGKSSLFRLLLGFEKPEAGAIYYDAQDLAGLDVQVVRQQVGAVIQNARLASGSILENILGSAPLTVDDAWEAARLAGLAQDISEMPMGMHTIVSEGGGNLSGGQRQRLLIARALVRRPRLFLFDEATSALDNRTQALVSRSLETLQSTRLVIAHRLSSIVNANRIYVMEKGVLVESGSYNELVNQSGLFRELAKRQLT